MGHVKRTFFFHRRIHTIENKWISKSREMDKTRIQSFFQNFDI